MRVRLNFRKVRSFLFGVIIVFAIFAGGYYLGVQGYKAEVDKALHISITRETPPDKNVDFSLFWNVWDTLSSKYFDKSKLIPSEMVYGAISGMVSALGDPYTMFLPPKENKIVDEDLKGSFEGVGIEIGYRGTRLAVVSPLPSSPAEKAGVKAGDYIIHIKDESKNIDIGTDGILLPDAVQAIRGTAGTKVTLTLIRDGTDSPITVDLTRAKLNVPSVTLSFVGNSKDIAYIKLSKFGAETTGEWDKAVSEILKKSEVTEIIIDVRNDPGGYLQGAIDIASDFVPAGTTVVMQQGGDGSRQEYRSQKFGRLQKYKVAVLINGGSASASEILAGALRDDRGFKLIGEKSFGKGTIQEPVEIPGGSGLHVTTAKWLTPDGIWVHENGLEPDVKITDDEKTTEDEQLQSAINLFQ
jgi:carboxyl-terminal processing protease